MLIYFVLHIPNGQFCSKEIEIDPCHGEEKVILEIAIVCGLLKLNPIQENFIP